ARTSVRAWARACGGKSLRTWSAPRAWTGSEPPGKRDRGRASSPCRRAVAWRAASSSRLAAGPRRPRRRRATAAAGAPPRGAGARRPGATVDAMGLAEAYGAGSPHRACSGTERVVVRRQIGSGSFGAVYEAFDKERQERVALKVLHATDPSDLYRFKREFRAL